MIVDLLFLDLRVSIYGCGYQSVAVDVDLMMHRIELSLGIALLEAGELTSSNDERSCLP